MIRLLDIFFSILGLFILLPLFLIISFVVKATSPGPVFFRQKRVGQNSIDFTLLKFRTMQVDSDKSSLLTIGNNDSRITFVGRHLRKLKLDELPQLFNVFIGNMSLVGPRPEVRRYVDMYSPGQMKILSRKPGITDWASIMFTDENEILAKSENPEDEYINTVIPLKIQYNQIFINHYGSYEYFKILTATLAKIIIPGFVLRSQIISNIK
jgi:lipopolysaccharide/colanic/teichoic acid biosynthesis glycosyltransferase